MSVFETEGANPDGPASRSRTPFGVVLDAIEVREVVAHA